MEQSLEERPWKIQGHLRYHRRLAPFTGVTVYKKFSLITLIAALALLPALALAANTIDSSLIPDGTYTVKVEQIMDGKHIKVTMDNGAETTLSAGRDSVDFGKIKTGDSVKLSLIKGQVMVYLDLTNH
jgi:translation initiation factor IF-1